MALAGASALREATRPVGSSSSARYPFPSLVGPHQPHTKVLWTYLLASSVLGPGYGTFFAVQGAWWCAFIGGVFTLGSAVGWALYRQGSQRAAAAVLVANIYIAPAWTLPFTGGVLSPIVIWLAPATFMAGALLGPRAAVQVGGLAIVNTVALALFGVDGVPQELTSPAARDLLATASATGAIALLSFYGWATTKNYLSSQAELAKQHTEVVAFSDELDRRNRAMRIVFDNVEQGFLTVDERGVIGAERSLAIDRWFRAPTPGEHLPQFVSEFDKNAAQYLALGLDDLREDNLPREVVLDQLPRSVTAGQRHLRVEYRCVEAAGDALVLMLVITDETESRRARAAEQRNQELVEVLRAGSRDRSGLLQFLAETEALVDRICRAELQGDVARDLHTLKGNTAVFGLGTFAALVHELEGRVLELATFDEVSRARLHRAWHEEQRRVEELGFRQDDCIRLPRADLEELQRLTTDDGNRAKLRRAVASLALVPTRPRLESLGRHAERLCERMGDRSVRVLLEDGGVRLPPDAYPAVWSALVHFVRNAIDHGLEGEAERVALGKPPRGTLRLSTALRGEDLTVEIADDGRGVDWQRIAARARAHGLASETRAQLVQALFADGVTTRDVVTDLSGRGVGASAVLAAVRAHGGSIEVESTPSKGTTFRCVLPLPTSKSLRPVA